MKRKNKEFWNLVLLVAIILIAFVDAFSSFLANVFPVIGTILESIGNIIYEIIELLLVFGLYKINEVN
jgi:phage-related protein